ncbi:delta-aminolevulinic acid dehydratase [Paenibacillus sp. FSL H8-0548]|uniref:porphobilinogen synthase n=1 Tax=Paenibacillus sp. FSL H8-0548 TaxID=1920422 RepID=UPI00096C768D|nr:porphobilinogen synthase [Paenibacillus sp. FSL H8-0548]OMF31656.1 delta-aminolevulinic acid dehydratase [Paenibacillus sp. FSL H8-0548]
MIFPTVRNRRLRRTSALRSMVRETVLSANDFIYPIFVTYGHNIKEEIPSMPGVYHFSLDRLEEEIRETVAAGIQSVLLFGIPETKDALGTSAYDANGIVQQAIRAVKEWAPELVVVADTCLCQFTDHGHCGIVHVHEETGIAEVDNDSSLDLLVQTAVSQAEAGADIIAPSNMMDGFVLAIREGLDDAGYSDIAILSYSVKFASAYYGPFRDAAHSAPQFGDRKTYQMDPANVREALREAESDIAEGADMLMVKPALAYLDIVRLLKDKYHLPVAAYNVSAEYSMVKAAAANGWIDERSIVLETLTGMKRAGADLIITYHAKDAALWLKGAGEANE